MKNLKFDHPKMTLWGRRRGSWFIGLFSTFTLSAVIGIGAFMYLMPLKTEERPPVSQDFPTEPQSPLVMQADVILNTLKGNAKFKDFFEKGALEELEFAVNETGDYRGRRMAFFELKSSELLDMNGLKISLKSIIASKVRIADGDKGFRVDITDLDEAKRILQEAVTSAENLKPEQVVSTYGKAEPRSDLLKILEKQNDYDRYGFARFFFKTSKTADYDVHAVVVCSLDPYKSPRPYVPKVYVALPKEGRMTRVETGFLDRVMKSLSFDSDFNILSFALKKSDPRIAAGDIDTCLSVFIEQLAEAGR